MSLFIESIIIGWGRNLDYARRLVADLSEDRMVYQPAVNMNHPAWVLSHLNIYHPVIVAMLGGRPFEDPRGHRYGQLSKPLPNPAEYASKQELVSAFERGHADVVEALRVAGEEAFEAPMPLERWHGPFPKVGSILPYLMLVHENVHLGQVSAWRRVQGMPSV